MINFKSSVVKLKKYQPPLDGRRSFDGLRLDFNERTIGPGPNLANALGAIGKLEVGVYPEYDGKLESKIANYLNVDNDQIILFNGSDLAISHIFRTLLSSGEKLLMPTPSFSMFDQYAVLSDADLIRPKYSGDDLAFPEEEFYVELKKGVRLAVVCTPNNPTGGVVEVEKIKKWVSEFPETIFMIDEAYTEFSGMTAVGLTAEFSNIIVVRTFSKAFGLAGLRIGYSVSCKDLADVLKKVSSPYEVNIFAYELAKATLDDLDYMESYIDEVMRTSKPKIERFFSDSNIKFYPSKANFILFRPDDASKLEIFMKQNGILIRAQRAKEIEDAIRLTLGTADQMEIFINLYKKFLGK